MNRPTPSRSRIRSRSITSRFSPIARPLRSDRTYAGTAAAEGVSLPSVSAGVFAAAAAAWLTLGVVAESPWATYLSGAALDRKGGDPVSLAAFASGWLLMVLA